jgi:shikimate kinase
VTYHHLVLIGLSGSGKSTIGPRLARRLDLLYVDTDKSVVARTSKPIHEIFASEGEPVFRAYEREAVREAVAGPRAVISTGAGAPINPANRALLWEGNTVVWLDAPIEVLVARLSRSDRPGRERRPLLDGDAASKLPALLEARRPIYESAHVRVETDAARPDVVVTEILRRINPLTRRPRWQATLALDAGHAEIAPDPPFASPYGGGAGGGGIASARSAPPLTTPPPGDSGHRPTPPAHVASRVVRS